MALSCIVIAVMLEGILLPSDMAAKTAFYLFIYLFKDSYNVQGREQ